MNILMFHPWHRFALLYLARCLKDHTFYYCGNFQGWGPKFPLEKGPKNVKIIKWKDLKNFKFDVKLLVLSYWSQGYKKIIHDPRQKAIDIPIIWKTWWRTNLPEEIHQNYPIIFAIYGHARKSKFKKRWTSNLTPPDPTFWNGWKGNEKVAVYSSRAWYLPITINPGCCKFKEKTFLKEKGIKLSKMKCHFTATEMARLQILKRVPTIMNPKIPGDAGGNIPFKKYRETFRKARVYWEASPKPLSFSIVEAMTLGMPVVVASMSGNNHFHEVIRNGIDGYCSKDVDFLIEKILDFVEDLDLARKWGQKGKKRLNNLTNKEKTQRAFNWAFKVAYENWSEKH